MYQFRFAPPLFDKDLLNRSVANLYKSKRKYKMKGGAVCRRENQENRKSSNVLFVI
jgi:hypothetical protein